MAPMCSDLYEYVLLVNIFWPLQWPSW